MRPTEEMQNRGPRNKEMVWAARGDLYVAIIRRKGEKNKEARADADSRAEEEEKSEFHQGKTAGSNNIGGIFSWIRNPAVIPSRYGARAHDQNA